MKISGILCLLLIWSSMLLGQEKNFIDQNYIEVQGSAEIEVTPDEIYVVLTIQERDKKDKESLETLEKRMLEKLKAIGVDLEKQIAVRDYVSNFRFYWLKKTNILKRKEYIITVKDGKTLGEIYQEMERIGLSDIEIDHVSHSEIEKFRRKVKIEAIKIAKDKAQEMTEAIGQKLGKAIYIKENTSNYQPNFQVSNIMVQGSLSFSGRREADALDTPNIEFQKIRLTYSVLVRFALD